MLLALGAGASVLDSLAALTSPNSSSAQAATGLSGTSATPFQPGSTTSNACSSSNCQPQGGLSPATLGALLAAQSQTSASASPSASRSDSLKDMFSLLDQNGDGQISKSEFDNALGAGGTNVAQADDVFAKLDRNGDGSVSSDELASSLKSEGSHGHRHRHGGGSPGAAGSGGGSDALLQALQGVSTTSTTNSDGSITTALTYADGSKVTLTSPATATASGGAASSYNFVENLIRREAQAISSPAASSLSISA